jgi:hypothetical protein
MAAAVVKSAANRLRHPDPGLRLMNLENHSSAVGIDHDLTLAPVDFLSRIISPRATGLGGLDALAVDDSRTGAGLTADTLSIHHYQVVVQAFPGSVVAKADEPAIGRLVR